MPVTPIDAAGRASRMLAERIGKAFRHAPPTRDGTRNTVADLPLGGCSRPGPIADADLRLPTVSIRAGAPDKAAPFLSAGILSEQSNGREAMLPLSDEPRPPVASPRAAADGLAHAATMATQPLGWRRDGTMPGVWVAAADDAVARLVAGCPRDFETACLRDMGVEAEMDSGEDIDVQIAEEMGGACPAGAA